MRAPLAIFSSVYLTLIALLVYRYSHASFGIATLDLVLFGSISIIACLVVVLSSIQFKKIINPASLFSSFIFFYGFSFLPLTSLHHPLSLNTHLSIIISILGFLIGCFSYPLLASKLHLKNTLSSSRIINTLKYFNKKISIYILTSLSIIAFIAEVINLGYLPVTQMFSRFVYLEVLNSLIPFVHYLVMLAAVLPSWAFILYKNKNLTKLEFYCIHVIGVFIIFNFFSRQLILFYLISYALTYFYFKRVTIKQLLLLGIVVITMFLGIGAIRIMQDNVRKSKRMQLSQTHYLNSLSKSKRDITIVENYATAYSSNRFIALDTLVNQKDSTHYCGYGIYTFKPIVSVLFLNRMGLVDYTSRFNIPDAVPSYVADSYLDFGFIGSLLINISYALFAMYAFVAYNLKKKYAIVLLGAAYFCIAMTPFFNFFNTFFIWLVVCVNYVLISKTFDEQ